MISYQVYKVLHLLGVFLLVGSLTGLAAASLSGALNDRARKIASIAHGIGLVLALVAGFGLLARLGSSFAPWVWVKVAIWLLLGAGLVVARRPSRWSTLLFWLVPLLATVSAYFAVYKPGA